jgi:hypothetical protein
MPQLKTTATFSAREPDDEALTTIVARSVLEAALREGDEAELWFDIARGDESARLAIDVSTTDLEEILRLSGGDDVMLALDGEAIEGLFGDPDVQAHGLKGALAIAVTSAAILAPAGQAALPQTANAASTIQRANPAATTQVSSVASRAQVSGAQAKTQVSSLASRTQVSGAQAKTQVSKQLVVSASGLRLLRGGLAR